MPKLSFDICERCNGVGNYGDEDDAEFFDCPKCSGTGLVSANGELDMPLKWVCNAQKPSDKFAFKDFSETMTYQEYAQWYSRHTIGELQIPPNSDATVDELKKMGLVGLYEEIK